jgi:hypothetical protein
MYLNPHHNAGGTTREATMTVAEEDINDFIRTNGSSNGEIIIGGDLNTDIDEMEE